MYRASKIAKSADSGLSVFLRAKKGNDLKAAFCYGCLDMVSLTKNQRGR